MAEKEFKNQVVIITGASSGIGRACAIEFSRKGAKIVLASRNKSRLEKVKEEIINEGGQAYIVQADVKEIEDCKNLIDSTVDHYGKIDVLINNAGISMRASFEEMELSVMKTVMDTNFYGAVYCTKFALPHLLKQKGLIIGMSSITGLTPLPGRTAYVASKHALDGFLNTIRIENLKKGVRVLLVHPGFTTSNIRNLALNGFGKPQKETPRNEGEMMSAEEVAAIIARASLNHERDLVLTLKGKLAVWLYSRFPAMTDKLIYNEMSKEPDAPL
jgi:short-subunit dehydrogenase